MLSIISEQIFTILFGTTNFYIFQYNICVCLCVILNKLFQVLMDLLYLIDIILRTKISYIFCTLRGINSFKY